MDVKQRLEALRSLMRSRGIDMYLVESEDFHGSEYVSEYFQCRAYISGFTGSAGTAVITQDWAGLWTDGRYFLQADRQLEGSGFTLCRMGEEGVPTVREYILSHIKAGQKLGFDGRTVNAATGRMYHFTILQSLKAVIDIINWIFLAFHTRLSQVIRPIRPFPFFIFRIIIYFISTNGHFSSHSISHPYA